MKKQHDNATSVFLKGCVVKDASAGIVKGCITARVLYVNAGSDPRVLQQPCDLVTIWFRPIMGIAETHEWCVAVAVLLGGIQATTQQRIDHGDRVTFIKIE